MAGVLVLALMVAGIALILGAKQFAGRTAKGIVFVAALAAAVPCALQCCGGLRPERSIGCLRAVLGSIFPALAMLALALFGLVAWRRRSERAKSRELGQRRHGAARPRALPPPPSAEGEGPR